MTTSASATERSVQTDRDIDLDIVKGFLVVGMVLFHVGTFSIVSSQWKHLAIGVLLSFVSGSWVFLAGYVVGYHYAPRYRTNRAQIARRLVSRGLKILLLFMVVNTLIYLAGLAKSSWSLSLDHMTTVVLRGGGNLSSFEILVGIGLLLLLAPVFLEFFLRFHVLSFCLLVASALPGSFGFNYAPNVWMLICGACGIWIGLALSGEVGSRLRDARRGTVVLLAMLFGVVSHFWLFYFGASRQDIIIYLLGVVTVNGFVYFYLSSIIERFEFLSYIIVLLGRYSLFSYLWQMGIIWGLIYSILYFNISPIYFRDVLVVLVLLVLSVVSLDYLRRRLSSLDELYRIIFA